MEAENSSKWSVPTQAKSQISTWPPGLASQGRTSRPLYQAAASLQSQLFLSHSEVCVPGKAAVEMKSKVFDMVLLRYLHIIYLPVRNTDIMLISETHFTDKGDQNLSMRKCRIAGRQLIATA
jgi:hypothetical protein